MASLKSIADLTWRQLFPKGSDETKITREEFLATAKSEYGYQFWIKSKADKAEDGEFYVPSYLLTEDILEVKDNEADISKLKSAGKAVMQGMDQDMWLQNIGGIGCECTYIRTTVNRAQALCGDDSLPDDVKTYLVIGNKIKFPRGTHTTSLPIIYANNGSKVNSDIEVDEVIGAMVRRGLLELYAGKVGAEDVINDSVEP